MTEPQPLLLSTGQAARTLGFGRTKLLSLVRSGRLRCVMDGARIRIPFDAITAYVDSLQPGYVRGKAVQS